VPIPAQVADLDNERTVDGSGTSRQIAPTNQRLVLDSVGSHFGADLQPRSLRFRVDPGSRHTRTVLIRYETESDQVSVAKAVVARGFDAVWTMSASATSPSRSRSMLKAMRRDRRPDRTYPGRPRERSATSIALEIRLCGSLGVAS
jgi:hypothetical protein